MIEMFIHDLSRICFEATYKKTYVLRRTKYSFNTSKGTYNTPVQFILRKLDETRRVFRFSFGFLFCNGFGSRRKWVVSLEKDRTVGYGGVGWGWGRGGESMGSRNSIRVTPLWPDVESHRGHGPCSNYESTIDLISNLSYTYLSV